MHSHDSGKDRSAFEEEIERILEEAGDGTADFTRFVFPEVNYGDRQFDANCIFWQAEFTQDAYFIEAEFRQDAYFTEATFRQDADFSMATFTQKADFSRATFTEVADFSAAAFARDANFVKAIFTDTADFGQLIFGQLANFSQATFTRDANFSGASFLDEASFSGATFTQDAHFEEAIFAQDSSFDRATFSQDAHFNGARFTPGADFFEATFTHAADFSRATFTQDVFFGSAKFLGGASFRETQFRRDGAQAPGPVFSLAQFSHPEAVVFYKTYLGQALFHNCDVSRLTFSSVEWRRREGRGKRMVFEEVVDLSHESANALKPTEGSPDERDYGLIADLYQQLKKNYDEKKDYWTAGDFHYGEMEMRRLSSRTRNPVARWLHSHAGLVAWYKYVSQYGESYLRPVAWIVGVLLAFALLFPIVGLHYDPSRGSRQVTGGRAPSPSQPESASLSGESSPAIVLTYRHPIHRPDDASKPLKAELRLFGNSCVTALDIAAFQKERVYEPAYPWGRLLILLEMILTSTLFALFLLAVRRQFRR
jgi:uncharacterized protein YjbI with pentapeptide repeats